MSRNKILTSVGLVAIGAVLAGSGTAVAASGGAFVLGRDNTASTPTILRNSAAQPNLTLPAARAGQPPLAVSPSSGKVNHFNSDKLDGLDSTSFALAAGRVGSIETLSDLWHVGDGTPDLLVASAACPAGTKLTGGGHEVYTLTGAVVSRAEGNAWLVVSVADEGWLADDVIAVAQCYNPRGAVVGAVEQFRSPDDVRLTERELTKLKALAAKR